MNVTVPRATVIGHPIAHSRSPLIHNHWIRQHGLRGRYAIQDVAPADLSAFISNFRSDPDHLGCNVTIPHKESVASMVDELTETARTVGAVNTIFKKDRILVGDNTDSYGFRANLESGAPGWRSRPGHIVIIGAGGATRGIIHALSREKDKSIKLFNRTRSKAEHMADELGKSCDIAISVHDYDEVSSHLSSAALLINATSIGMQGTHHDQLDLSRLPGTALVTDIVYTPLITPMLTDARALGLDIVDGLGMLLHQAVPGFEHWFGIRPAVDQELRDLVVRDLEAH